MRIEIPGVVAFCIAVSVGIASPAFGQLVEFGISDVGAGSLAGVYTDPYQGYVGPAGINPLPGAGATGTAVAAFCDDFVNDVSPPEQWLATQTDLSALTSAASNDLSLYYTNTNGGAPQSGSAYSNEPSISSLALSQTADYIAVAYLASESLAAGSLTAQEDYSYAIWDIFDPTLLGSDNDGYGNLDNPSISSPTPGSNWAIALADVNAALNVGNFYASNGGGAAFEASIGMDVNIYTPVGGSGTSAPPVGPQEFVTLTPVPEPSSLATLSLDGAGVGILLGLVFWRRRYRSLA